MSAWFILDVKKKFRTNADVPLDLCQQMSRVKHMIFLKNKNNNK